MVIGVPKEIKTNENRIALVPAGAELLTARGHTVYVEKDASKADLDQPKVAGDIVPEDFEARSPDKVTVFLNVQSHPSIIRVCLDGLAFRTVSDHYAGLATPAVDRVPEWDAHCTACSNVR